jgi:hypothetical protein
VEGVAASDGEGVGLGVQHPLESILWNSVRP